MRPWILLCLAGCPFQEAQLQTRRVWEMQDHEVAAAAARDALVRGDFASARGFGEEIARKDPITVPENTVVYLEAVRDGGALVADAPTLHDAAVRLARLTESCADCHIALGVPPVDPRRRSARDLLWVALVWESDPYWRQGLVRQPDALDVAGWEARRAAMASAMVDGTLE